MSPNSPAPCHLWHFQAHKLSSQPLHYTVKVNKNEQVKFNVLIHSVSVFNLAFVVHPQSMLQECVKQNNHTISLIIRRGLHGQAFQKHSKMRLDHAFTRNYSE